MINPLKVSDGIMGIFWTNTNAKIISLEFKSKYFWNKFFNNLEAPMFNIVKNDD